MEPLVSLPPYLRSDLRRAECENNKLHDEEQSAAASPILFMASGAKRDYTRGVSTYCAD